MTLIVEALVVLVLVYFAVRVARMPRSLPFLVAYPLFVFILGGGGVAVFVGASWAATWLRVGREVSLSIALGGTAVGLFVLWWVALRAIR